MSDKPKAKAERFYCVACGMWFVAPKGARHRCPRKPAKDGQPVDVLAEMNGGGDQEP